LTGSRQEKPSAPRHRPDLSLCARFYASLACAIIHRADTPVAHCAVQASFGRGPHVAAQHEPAAVRCMLFFRGCGVRLCCSSCCAAPGPVSWSVSRVALFEPAVVLSWLAARLLETCPAHALSARPPGQTGAVLRSPSCTAALAYRDSELWAVHAARHDMHPHMVIPRLLCLLESTANPSFATCLTQTAAFLANSTESKPRHLLRYLALLAQYRSQRGRPLIKKNGPPPTRGNGNAPPTHSLHR
jgi:hypothetical protein